MRRAHVFMIGISALAILAGTILPVVWFYVLLETPYYRAPAAETFVEIPQGFDSGKIADTLVAAGILRSRIPFIAYLRFTGNAQRIKAGEYRFNGPANPRQVAQRLILGDVHYLSVTVPEGLTALETVELLAQHGLGDINAMKSALSRTEWIRDLDPDAENLEGFLFPETYFFGRKCDSQLVIRTMVEQFRKQLGDILAHNPLPAGWNVSRVVTLASMIEKEVQAAGERPLVSSVFHNRLKRNMPLACDATIIYAMKLAGTYRGNIRKTDLAMISPYNSYRNPDLPPGPIANPGADALRAALNPAETDYLYYVSRNDGTHAFSRNYRAHEQEVEKYQLRRSRR